MVFVELLVKASGVWDVFVQFGPEYPAMALDFCVDQLVHYDVIH